MKINENKSKNKSKQSNKNEKNKYLNKKRNRSSKKIAKNIDTRKLISEKKNIKKQPKNKNEKNTSIKSKKFEKKNKNVTNFNENSTKQTNKKNEDESMKLICEIKDDVQKEFKKLKKSDKNYKNKIEKLLQKNNLNNNVVFEYLNNINSKAVKPEEIKFLKFTLSPEQQNILIKKKIFTDIFDTKQELIYMLKIIKDNKDSQKTLGEFEEIKKKINLKKIINPFIYTLNYDQDNMFAFCFFLILEFLEMDIYQIESVHNISNKNFSEYINSLNKENINKNELLYIYFSFFNYEIIYNDTLTKINENIRNKKKENIFEKLKNKIKEQPFNENDKDINFTKLNYILENYPFNKELFNEIYNKQIFLFKKVQEENYFFFNENMKNNYFLHLKKLLFSDLMNKIFEDFKDDFIEKNQQNHKLNFNYIFKNEKSFKELKNHFHFFPFNIEQSITKVSGLTIKNTLDIIIFVYPKNIKQLNQLIKKHNEKKKKFFLFNHIVNSAYFFLTIIHESSGHYLFTYYYYLDTSKKTTSTPKKTKINEYLEKKLGDKVEDYDRGAQIEGLLFGDLVTSLTFWGAIFILTCDFSKIKNYEDLATKFNQYNKKKIKNNLLEDLDLEGSDILREILDKYGFSINDLKADNFLDDFLENITFRTRSSNSNLWEFDVYLNNDVMGNYDVVLSKKEKIQLMGFK